MGHSDARGHGGFVQGDRVVFTTEYLIWPHDIVRAGERGVVNEIDPDADPHPIIMVLLDEPHEGLAEWDNEAWVEVDVAYLYMEVEA